MFQVTLVGVFAQASSKASIASKARSRLYISRICKYFGYPKDQLTKLFDLLIVSLNTQGQFYYNLIERL